MIQQKSTQTDHLITGIDSQIGKLETSQQKEQSERIKLNSQIGSIGLKIQEIIDNDKKNDTETKNDLNKIKQTINSLKSNNLITNSNLEKEITNLSNKINSELKTTQLSNENDKKKFKQDLQAINDKIQMIKQRDTQTALTITGIDSRIVDVNSQLNFERTQSMELNSKVGLISMKLKDIVEADRKNDTQTKNDLNLIK